MTRTHGLGTSNYRLEVSLSLQDPIYSALGRKSSMKVL